jgi:hypothetical protein
MAKQTAKFLDAQIAFILCTAEHGASIRTIRRKAGILDAMSCIWCKVRGRIMSSE